MSMKITGHAKPSNVRLHHHWQTLYLPMVMFLFLDKKGITWFTGTIQESDVDCKPMDADFRILSNLEILLEVQGLERRIHYKSVTHISTTDDTKADIDNLVHKEKESANRSTENNAPASFVSNLSINNIRLEAFSVK